MSTRERVIAEILNRVRNDQTGRGLSGPADPRKKRRRRLTSAARRANRAALLMVAAMTLALLPGAAHADAWQGNEFHSPSTNLVCKYWNGGLTCGSYASQKIVTMTPYGRPLQGRYLGVTGQTSHLLPYGWTWHTNGYTITCTSLFSGMRCVNRAGWAFKIYREGYTVSYRGQVLWTI